MKLSEIIPGGAHTYSKGDDQFPQNAPSTLEEGDGCYVYDAQGNRFLDFGMGLRSVTLGYKRMDVIDAAYQQMIKGSNFTRPSLIEGEAARRLVELIDGMDMCKFAKNGSTVTSAAVKLARAYTKRDLIARCRQHPFFSYDDWFIASTVVDAGTTKDAKEQTLLFDYNDVDSLENLFIKHPNRIACVIMEPITTDSPIENYLNQVKEICHEHGAVFIIDEMITGFRFDLKGAQHYFGVVPDMCTFGKGMANGFSVAALLGKREIMSLGNIDGDQDRVFLTSTTHGAENHGLAAFLQVLDIYEKEPVIEHIWEMGELLRKGLNEAILDASLSEYIEVTGFPCNLNIVYKDSSGTSSMPFRTLALQEMVKHKVLIPYIAISYSHQKEDILYAIEAYRKMLDVYKEAINEGWERFVEGPIVKPVFRKTNR